MAGRIPAGLRLAGAFLASAGFFLVAAAASPIRHQLVLVLAVAGTYVYVVLIFARRLGPSYSFPLAIAGAVAFDWYYIPPTHDLGADDWKNWLAIVIYIAIGVLVGMLATRFRQRAEVSEESRGELLKEQAALRRVATLVAQEASPASVFRAVAEELTLLLGTDATRLFRYEDGDTATVVAHVGAGEAGLQAGTQVALGGNNITTLVFERRRTARIDDYRKADGPISALARPLAFQSMVGGPVVVDGKLWGAIVVGSFGPGALPADTESRIDEFTSLMATGLSNVQARAELAASRARIVAAADDERRRVVRDLHDGAQQRLVHTVVTLKLAARALERNEDTGAAFVREALEQAETAMVELRELAHGILPSVLNRGGLRAGVEALASRMPVPVEIGVAADRFPKAVEATAYFVIAEALTNVAKHADAARATVTAGVDNGTLRVEIADDGAGTADPNGHGLLGVADRLATSDGSLEVLSAPGSGTRVIATVPLVPRA